MTNHVILLGLAIAFLAGCAGTPDAPEQQPPVDPAPQATAAASPQPADPDAGGPASASCTVTVNVGAGVAGGPSMSYLGCAFGKAASGDLSRFDSALVEVAWRDPFPTVTGFDFFLVSDSCDLDPADPCSHDHVSSSEPLVRYEVPRQVLQDFGSDGLRAYATFEGVAVQQDVAIAITLVPPGVSLPAEYSALS